MQATEIRTPKKPKVLSQGSVFSLAGLTFNGDGRAYTLKDFYPEITADDIKHGIVLSQDCDLYRDENRPLEISHISVALLEPFSRRFQELQTSNLDKFFFNHDISGFTFVNQDELDERVRKDVERVLNNNHSYLYFLALGRNARGKSKEYYLVNISKMIPVRVEHYDALLSKLCYQLKSEFANKLGWKIATYFGRVGTPDYPIKEMKKIARDLYRALNPKQGDKIIPLSKEGFNKAKTLQGMKEDKALRLLAELNSDPIFKPQP